MPRPTIPPHPITPPWTTTRRFFFTSSSSKSASPFSFSPNHPNLHQAKRISNTVVGSFLIKYPSISSSKSAAAFPLIALFRRSAKVKQFPLKLGPIAGSKEETDSSPYEAALRELDEETGLIPGTSPGLELFSQGRPYPVEHANDKDVVTAIFPYAFLMNSYTEKKIKLDWENDSWAWYTTEEIAHIAEEEGVVNLVKSLRRVFIDFHVGTELGTMVRLAIARLKELGTLRKRQRSHADSNNSNPNHLREEEAIMLIVGTYISLVKNLDRGQQQDEEAMSQWWNKLRWVGVHMEMNADLNRNAEEVLLRTLEVIHNHYSEGAKFSADALVRELESYQSLRLYNRDHLRLYQVADLLKLKYVMLYEELERADK